MKKNYIIREIPGEQADFNSFFDDDGLTSAGGDFCYNLFIIGYNRMNGFNSKEYQRIQSLAEDLIDAFEEVENGEKQFYRNFKEAMRDNGITEYNAHKCHALREWVKTANTAKPESIAAFLTIYTGKKWSTSCATGYCQGDYVDLVFCQEHYSEDVNAYGEVWLGAAKEFCVIDLDEHGKETDFCYGFIIADCQASKDEDYKSLVCEWAGIKQEETILEMIDGWHTHTTYDYRVA